MKLRLETKGWGAVRHAFDAPNLAVSILHTEPGGYCSRHWHRERVNRFVVVTGAIDVVRYHNDGMREAVRYRVGPGEVCDIEAGVVHRFEVVEPGIVVEVYWPARWGHEQGTVRLDDIVRLDTGGKR